MALLLSVLLWSLVAMKYRGERIIFHFFISPTIVSGCRARTTRRTESATAQMIAILTPCRVTRSLIDGRKSITSSTTYGGNDCAKTMHLSLSNDENQRRQRRETHLYQLDQSDVNKASLKRSIATQGKLQQIGIRIEKN